MIGNHADGPFEVATWDVSRAHFYGEARRWLYTYLPEGHEQVTVDGDHLNKYLSEFVVARKVYNCIMNFNLAFSSNENV